MKTYLFIAGLIAVAAFLLLSLNFGWPGMESGWHEVGTPKPRWFPSVFGGAVAITTSIFAFWLMRRWKS
jgi:hypothetical protein